MSVSTQSQRIGLTWEAFVELPEELLKNAELYDGEVYEVASPGRPHQLTLVQLIGAFLPWVNAYGGEIVPDPHVKIAADRGYKPDLAWYEPSRVPSTGYWTQAPNLAVEILSPSTRRLDAVRKPGDYFKAGVQEVWLIDVDERYVMVLRPDELAKAWVDGDTVQSSLLPGFSMAVDDLIARCD